MFRNNLKQNFIVCTEFAPMKIQTVKHSVSKVAGLMAIASTAALFSLPALAGVGEAVNRMKNKPQTTSQEVPATPAPMTTESTTPAPMTAEPVAPDATTSESTAPASTTTEPQAAEGGTIVDIASSNGSFTTLAAALEATGLSQELSGQGPFTVFAPTDAAFEALPPGTVEKLMKPENKQVLKKILSYHVVPGEVESTALKSGQVQTVEGTPVEVSVDGTSVMVNDARVTTPDIRATNGVIHVIDKVILPPEM